MAAKRIVVVGAGISGLSLAYYLGQAAPATEVVVLERDQRPGGAAWTLRESGYQLELGPNGFLDTKPTTLNLCHKLGLGDSLVAANPASRRRFLFLHDRLKLLPGTLGSFLRSDLLSPRSMLALLVERFRSYPRQARDESIAAFVRRHVGGAEANLLADAMVTGIYAGDPSLLSLPACFPRLAGFEREFGSVLKGFGAAARQRQATAGTSQPSGPPAMWSLHQGMRRLVETLAGQLPRPPLYGVTVRGLRKATDGATWIVRGEGDDYWEADAVALTCPAHQQAGILADTDGPLADQVGTIAYNRVVVVGLGYHRRDIPLSLDGFGFIAPQKTRRDLLGVQWCSSLFPGRAPEGEVLLRAMCGGWQRPEIAGWPEERLVSSLRGELRLAMGVSAAPVFQKIIRWDRAIPQYFVGHLARLRWLDERLARHPGLFLGGNGYRGVALNDCTEQGEILAARIGVYLQALVRSARRTGSGEIVHGRAVQ